VAFLRLLTIDQVTKLSKVYRSIKGASYEAEWIRRNSGDFDSLADDNVFISKNEWQCDQTQKTHGKHKQNDR
jgi:hypothetical protein